MHRLARLLLMNDGVVMWRSLTIPLSVLILPLLGGCTALPFSAGYTTDESEFGERLAPAAESLLPGQASDGDVLDALGPPAAVTALPEGYAFLYEAGRLSTKSVGASVYSLKAGYAWSDAQFAIGAFVFDSTGRLTGRAIERSDGETGRGFSIGTQKSQAAEQAIYFLPYEHHRWGSQMLRQLPRTLNQPNNPDSGKAGLERRGTTVKVGQRSLESGYLTALALLDMLKTQSGN
jgi:hypothetical protein